MAGARRGASTACRLDSPTHLAVPPHRSVYISLKTRTLSMERLAAIRMVLLDCGFRAYPRVTTTTLSRDEWWRTVRHTSPGRVLVGVKAARRWISLGPIGFFPNSQMVGWISFSRRMQTGWGAIRG